MRVGVGVSVLLVCDFDCWKSRIKLPCRILLSVRRIGPVQYGFLLGFPRPVRDRPFGMRVESCRSIL